MYEIHNRFCLRKINPTIEKSPLAEVSRFRWFTSSGEQIFQHFLHNERVSMTVDFQTIFSRERVWARKESKNHIVDQLTEEIVVIGVPRGSGQGSPFEN
jgi:hypothetical protein